MTEPDPARLWYQTNLDIFLNRWFANYEPAREALDEQGGFLLPYQNHFYLCKAEVIRALGLDPSDPDWEKVGYDCARPKDLEAFARLRNKRERVLRSAAGEGLAGC